MRSDADLIAAVAGGDRSALRELFVRHHEDVLNVVYPILGRKGTAEDVVQETFLTLVKSASGYRGEGRPTAWLYRIAINLSLMELRRDKRQLPADSMGDAPSDQDPPEVSAERADIQSLVLAALQQLPGDQRAAITLTKIKGLSVEECGRVMECDEGTVKSRVHYGMQRMRHILVSMGLADGSH